MDQILEKRIFYINSGNQLSGSNNVFTYTANIPEWGRYNRATILQASIPVSYYAVQDGYNHFILTENGSSVTITVPAGNYNVNSFATVVNGLMNSNSPNGYSYVMKYPISYSQPDTGKFAFTCSNLVSTITLTFPSSTTINQQFGFDFDSSASYVGGSLTSKNVVSFVPEPTLYLHSNIVSGENDTDVLETFFSANSIPYSVFTFINPDPITSSKRLTTRNCRALTFSITDESGFPIFLNGQDIVFTLCLYKSNDIYHKAEQYMKYQLNKDLVA